MQKWFVHIKKKAYPFLHEYDLKKREFFQVIIVIFEYILILALCSELSIENMIAKALCGCYQLNVYNIKDVFMASF